MRSRHGHMHEAVPILLEGMRQIRQGSDAGSPCNATQRVDRASRMLADRTVFGFGVTLGLFRQHGQPLVGFGHENFVKPGGEANRPDADFVRHGRLRRERLIERGGMLLYGGRRFCQGFVRRSHFFLDGQIAVVRHCGGNRIFNDRANVQRRQFNADDFGFRLDFVHRDRCSIGTRLAAGLFDQLDWRVSGSGPGIIRRTIFQCGDSVLLLDR